MMLDLETEWDYSDKPRAVPDRRDKGILHQNETQPQVSFTSVIASSWHSCWVQQSSSITWLQVLWPASGSHTFHLIIHAFSPNHCCSFLNWLI